LAPRTPHDETEITPPAAAAQQGQSGRSGREHELYGEVFAGMGSVFFRRRMAPKVEVLNDLSGDVATFFRVVQNHHQAL